ncbi:MAG: aldehyde dehydrogenase family protein [Hyphomicrobiales bacterium]
MSAMSQPDIPKIIPNWIDGLESGTPADETFGKRSPVTGREICRVARSRSGEVNRAIDSAAKSFSAWSAQTPVMRGNHLLAVTQAMRRHRDDIAAIVAAETGMSFNAAGAETEGAIALGEFMAGEGRRLYGRSTTSAVPHKTAMTMREPMGVAGLIIPANTPIANVAWKVFPALVCGNTAVLKAAEDTPATAWFFGKLAHTAGLPPGVLNIIQGLGEEAGTALVADPRVAVVSFTGSTAVGRQIAQVAGSRLAKVSLELGGKNPFIVCDDADLELAAKWAILSAFSNAGQRCAAGSRIIIFEPVYERFRDMLIERTRRLKVGPGNDADFGPVINAEQLQAMVSAVEQARAGGAAILTGGGRMDDPVHAGGFYMAPTLIEKVHPEAEISTHEIFGPVACLYQARDFTEAVDLANRSPYGLTACIHTRSIHRALEFVRRVQAGVAVVNAGTFGSEPHMPFGGVKQSGTGSREPGTEALDVYSNLKTIYIAIDPIQV